MLSTFKFATPVWNSANLRQLPLTTVIVVNVGHDFAGTIIIETIFSMPGMGLNFFNALSTRDIYPLMTWLIGTTTLAMLINLVADVLYGLLDPRMRAHE